MRCLSRDKHDLGSQMADMANAAIKEHGSALDAILVEPIGRWPVKEAQKLLRAAVRELARAEKQRRDGLPVRTGN